MIRNKLFLVLLLMGLSLSSIRVVGYLNNYGTPQNLFRNSEAERVLSAIGFSSRSAVNLLIQGDKQGRVLTFRQADLLPFLDSGWTSSFAPEAEKIFQGKDVFAIKRTLQRMKIEYLHIPNYYWPSIYTSPLMGYLADPKSIRPLIPLDQLRNSVVQESQLFVNEPVNLKSSCRISDFPNLYVIEKNFMLRDNLLSFISGIPVNRIEKILGKNSPKIGRFDLGSVSTSHLLIGSQIGKQWKINSRASYISLVINGKNSPDAINSLSVSTDAGLTWNSLMETIPTDSSFRLSAQFKMGNFERVMISISSNEDYSRSFRIESIQVCEWW
jgi:hypothetical protein